MVRQIYSHDPQHYVLREQLKAATVATSAGDSPEAVGSGIRHGATAVRVKLKNVEVRSSRHYFCYSHDATIVSGDPRGDNGEIAEDCHAYVDRVPRDGSYDVLLDVIRNNGAIECAIVGWYQPGTAQRVRAKRFVDIDPRNQHAQRPVAAAVV